MENLQSLPVNYLFSYFSTVDAHAMPNSNGTADLLLKIKTGYFEGERLKGKLNTDFCSDQGVYRPSGAIKSEVHLLLITDDDAEIHMHYMASTIPDSNGGFKAFNFPFFETANDKYSWLNTTQAITLYNFDSEEHIRCDVYALL